MKNLVIYFILIPFTIAVQNTLLDVDASTWTVGNGFAPDFPKYRVIVENVGELDTDSFFENGNVPTLKEIKKYIQNKGHLPNISSAQEVEANGIEMGEINRLLLLEEIGELTLYII